MINASASIDREPDAQRYYLNFSKIETANLRERSLLDAPVVSRLARDFDTTCSCRSIGVTVDMLPTPLPKYQ